MPGGPAMSPAEREKARYRADAKRNRKLYGLLAKGGLRCRTCGSASKKPPKRCLLHRLVEVK